ncbi:NUDIX hydrolase [Paenibacillus periandrae]|uniref:NUDIX hydrolase n=1 Tax=Paenibacillus periandrae TaxID=1761741 RepID=UPI001F09F126|nr:NUDIX domain-containing protein [Paenibacillus periandrae]
MLSKLINLIPHDWLVYMYKHVPFKKFKDWVVYRAQNKFLVSVLGIITNETGQVLLLRHVYRTEPWGVPGGWMELEKPEVALEREIYEETKLKVEITGLAKAIFGQNPVRVDLIFRGRIVNGTFTPSAEISEMIYCDIDDWPEGMPNEQKRLIKEMLTNS